MRIAALSWRYLDHPAAGGAEVVTHEVLRRLVDRGHEVTSFTASYPGAAPEGELDGVRLRRSGGPTSVHMRACRWLRPRLDGFDRVIDQINTIPFMTPLYVPAEKRVFFIHQLAREYWWRETRGAFRALSPLGYLAEPIYLRLYRGTPGITVSESTQGDLAALGVRDVTVVPQALTTAALDPLPPKQATSLRLVMVGRLTPAKFVEEGIEAYARLHRDQVATSLDVVGEGDPRYRATLEARVAALGLTGVSFHGRLQEAAKLDLLRTASIQLFTSHREGWGLVVSEAAAMGTPTVGYDVPGVRDAVADPRLLAPKGDSAALAALVLRLAQDADLYEAVRRRGWERARGMSGQATANAFGAVLGT